MDLHYNDGYIPLDKTEDGTQSMQSQLGDEETISASGIRENTNDGAANSKHVGIIDAGQGGTIV